MRRTTVAAGMLAMSMITTAALALSGWDDPVPSAPAAPAKAPADQPAAKNEAPFDLNRLAFLSGRWSSKDGGGLTEEHWSNPSGNNIMGMFRWCKPDGTPAMFEILTITREADGVYLRLRHYSAKLVAKDEKDKPITMKLDTIEEGKVVFKAHAHGGDLSHITYQSPVKDTLHIEVAFKPELKREALEFTLKREVAAK